MKKMPFGFLNNNEAEGANIQNAFIAAYTTTSLHLRDGTAFGAIMGRYDFYRAPM
ncbi:MAG: hypothetical protein LBF66_01365 [Holosporales bacterium]|jgi:hypothetical protein|nr:hypothetical protein [Holosporales bacterium]